MDAKFNTPILLLVFNRPDTTEKVFQTIKTRKPSRLYIAADGPRKSIFNEDKLCKRVLEIATNVDWHCEVKTLVRQENLGCKQAVSKALDWFFSEEEEGIILEDDCLPSEAFFDFCSEALYRFRDDNSIGIISGTSFLKAKGTPQIYISPFMPIWGWAGWRRSWSLTSQTMTNLEEWIDTKALKNHFPIKAHEAWIINMLIKAHSGEINSWDIPMFYHLLLNGKLALRISHNLIKNIGYEGTNTNKIPSQHPSFNMPTLMNLETIKWFLDKDFSKKKNREESKELISIFHYSKRFDDLNIRSKIILLTIHPHMFFIVRKLNKIRGNYGKHKRLR
ncbi:MAG: hypothetical protein HC842_06965 [Cytophagales bacterium]|nr:hypothetical protein [Cytophagales bacterium]